jgi:phosphatidylserine decarboxylase
MVASSPWKRSPIPTWNVHSHKSPVDGAVKGRWYSPGSFVNADLDKASTENERNAIWIHSARGDVTCVQIAGLIARRILCYVATGDKLVRGQRYGFIRFGSRVDVYLPTTTRAEVSIGQKVTGGRTILARW